MNKNRVWYIAVGMVSGMGMLLIMGATVYAPPNYGRYQISAWGSPFVKDTAGVGVFIVDTATGETKTAYSRFYGETDTVHIEKSDLIKPFGIIQ